MVDKGKLESSGCLGGGNDHFIAVLNTDEPQDTIDDLGKAYLKPSSGDWKADPRLGRSHARYGGLPRRRRGELLTTDGSLRTAGAANPRGTSTSPTGR